MMNFNKRKAKGLTAGLLIFAMLLINCFSAFATVIMPSEYVDVQIPNTNKSFKTDSYGRVAIADTSNSNYGDAVAVRVYDTANGKWVKTTYSDGGFHLGVYKANTGDNLQIIATPSIVNSGNDFQMQISVKNVGTATASNFKPWIGADTMLDGVDTSTNTASADHLSITMEAHNYVLTIGSTADHDFRIFPTHYRNYMYLPGSNNDPSLIAEDSTRGDSAFVGYWVFDEDFQLGPGETVELEFGSTLGGGFIPVTEIIWPEYKKKTDFGEALPSIADAYAIGEYGEEPTYSEIEWDYDGYDACKPGTYMITATVRKGVDGEEEDYVEYFPVQVMNKPVGTNSGTAAVFRTGTWNDPVTDGSWKQDADGKWSYTTSREFRSTWGYIRNPYAKDGQSADGWFYFDANGKMLTGWQQINGKWYYLNSTSDGTLGMCYLNTVTPDGHRVDKNGARVD